MFYISWLLLFWSTGGRGVSGEECQCSGVSDDCSRVEMFWTREVFTPSEDLPGFTITDRDPDTWLGTNKPWYDASSRQVRYTFRQGDSTTFFWSMPTFFRGIFQFRWQVSRWERG